MEKLRNEIELIGGKVIDTSYGVFVRAFNKNEVKKIHDLIKKYPEYKLGCFVKFKIFKYFYYETVLER
jgi:hypothetical protein